MKNKKRRAEIILFKRREHKNFIKKKKQLKKKKKRKSTRLIKFLKDKNFTKKKKIRKIRKNKNHIKIPKNFSLIQNPDESIKILKEIFYIGINQKVKDIYIEHKNLVNLDICASTIMDVIIMEIERFRKNIIGNDFSIGGVVEGDNKKIREMLEVSGILKHLDFEVKEPEYIRKLELIECGEQGIVSTKIIDYLNECLNEQDFEFSREGYKCFSEMVGEVIDNCKIHGGEFTKWYTLGHYNMDDGIGECSLVIFNFGNTIYENLKYGEITRETKEALERITRYYQESFSSNLWSEESLWTLYSLQDGVSRFRDSKNDPDRGTGTVTFIDSFQKIGKTMNNKTPLMSITSGKVSILFDGRYSLKESDKKNEDRKIIAFNKENDLYKLPDKKNIRILENEFPGTVISMNFYLDRKYLVNITEEN